MPIRYEGRGCAAQRELTCRQCHRRAVGDLFAPVATAAGGLQQTLVLSKPWPALPAWMHQRTHLTGEFLMQARTASSCSSARSTLLLLFTQEAGAFYLGSAHEVPVDVISGRARCLHMWLAYTVPSQLQADAQGSELKNPNLACPGNAKILWLAHPSASQTPGNRPICRFSTGLRPPHPRLRQSILLRMQMHSHPDPGRRSHDTVLMHAVSPDAAGAGAAAPGGLPAGGARGRA